MKKALISVNFVGFIYFILDDIDILKRLGYEVTVTGDSSINGEHAILKINDYGAKFINIPIDAKQPITKKNYEGYKQLRKIINKEKFDLIICHTAVTGITVRLASIWQRIRGTKVVYMNHGLSYNHTSSTKEYLKYKLIESFCSIFTDAIITINNEDYTEFKKMFCKQIYYLNGVGLDTDAYTNVNIDRDKKLNSLNIPTDKIILIAAGELSKRKNHSTIVKAISKLSNKEKYVFVICGRVMTKEGSVHDLEKLGNDLGVDVRLLGFRNDLSEIYPCCQIGVMPSLREGLGMTGIQMLCAGLPIIGSDVQGIREYCIPEETGILVKSPLDTEGFANAIKKLSSLKVRESMKKNCIRISKKFSKEQSITQRIEIYKQIISKE